MGDKAAPGNNDLLYPTLLQLNETLADYFSRPKQASRAKRIERNVAWDSGEFCNSFGFCFSKNAVQIDRMMNFLFGASNFFAVAFDECKFVRQFFQSRMSQIASISITSN